jgi:hypothetical protein
MLLPRGTRRLSSARELEAVTSPLRQEVLEQVAHAGEASVADLARLMGRRPTALHYHVKLLHRAGLLRSAGRRPSGKRSETLYALSAPRFAVVGRISTPVLLRAAVRTLGASLRLTEREAAKAIHGGKIVGSGGRRNFYVRRHRARLTPASQVRVNRLLDQLEAVFGREMKRNVRARAGPGRPPAEPTTDEVFTLTLVLAPAGRQGPPKSEVRS